MNKICKQYISEVKSFFPIIGKSEKKYIAKLKANIESYCEDEEITTKEELYKNYGQPNDVVNDYFSAADTEYIVKKIKLTKTVKTILVSLLAVALISSVVYCTVLIREHMMILRQEMVGIETVIENSEESNITLETSEPIQSNTFDDIEE